ncbi:MAG: MerR family transcriptional regulator [Candidatus Dependentiae bacterium]|nr:MerR family transcriptional regulator [Candidatus Dependentiae bacterium]
MTKKSWYAKEFGTLTGVSVRALHHYDTIGLLKPSLRLSNGYRVYSETDLLKLQQIVALKFFGLKLADIKTLILGKTNTIEQLELHRTLLNKQVSNLHRAADMLDAIITDVKDTGLVDWQNIINLIGVYHMTQDLKKTSAGKVYSEDQLKQFAELKKQHTPEQAKAIEQEWATLIVEVKNNLHQDPQGSIGEKLAQTWINLVDKSYGSYTELRDATWLAYKHNKISNAPFDKKIWHFIEAACKAHNVTPKAW